MIQTIPLDSPEAAFLLAPDRKCRGMTELFYPSNPHDHGALMRAKLICLSCPHLVECREYALANHEEKGIWGGLSERQRVKIWRAQRRVALNLWV